MQRNTDYLSDVTATSSPDKVAAAEQLECDDLVWTNLLSQHCNHTNLCIKLNHEGNL